MQTSLGNEKYAEEHQDLVKKDVISICHVAYVKYTPLADGSGLAITAVICVDPAGSLPDFVKTQIAKSNGEMTTKMVKYL